MKERQLRKIWGLSLLSLGAAVFIFFFPVMSHGAGADNAQIFMSVNVSPNIINLQSERGGDIRILTDMRYSLFATSGHSIFIYFNDSDSVENIRPTRDSLGNLILKFSLPELLELNDWLRPNEVNEVKVVVSMDNGDEYVGQSEVMLSTKR